MKPNRVFIFDLLRIILILLVLNLHITSKVIKLDDTVPRIELLAVPLFLVLSFYLNAKYFVNDSMSFKKLTLRIHRLVVPLIFWTIVSFSSHVSVFTFKNILVQIITTRLFSSPLYYLNLLVYFTVICFLLSKVKYNLKLVLYFFIILSAFFLQYSEINYFLTLNQFPIISGRFIELIPYVIIGLLFSIVSTRILLEKRILLQVIILSLIGYLLSLAVSLPRGFTYQGLGYFFGTIFVFTLIHQLTKLNIDTYIPQNIQKIVNILGAYTFGVYLLHYTFLEIIIYFLPPIKTFILTYPTIFLFIFTTICYLCCIGMNYLTRFKFVYLFR